MSIKADIWRQILDCELEHRGLFMWRQWCVSSRIQASSNSADSSSINTTMETPMQSSVWLTGRLYTHASDVSHTIGQTDEINRIPLRHTSARFVPPQLFGPIQISAPYFGLFPSQTSSPRFKPLQRFRPFRPSNLNRRRAGFTRVRLRCR